MCESYDVTTVYKSLTDLIAMNKTQDDIDAASDDLMPVDAVACTPHQNVFAIYQLHNRPQLASLV